MRTSPYLGISDEEGIDWLIGYFIFDLILVHLHFGAGTWKIPLLAYF